MPNNSSPTSPGLVPIFRQLAAILVVVMLVLVAVAALVLLVFLIVVEFIAYFQSEAKFPFSADHTAVSTAIATLITAIFAVIGVAAAILAGLYAKRQLLIAKEQLLAGQKVARGDFLLRLDEVFRQYQDIRQRLREGGDWHRGANGPLFPQDLANVEGYLALFERVQALIEEGILNIETVESWYGDRVYNIVINPIIYKEKLEKRMKGWRDFIKLWDAIEQEREKSGRWRPRGRPMPKDLLERLQRTKSVCRKPKRSR